MTRADTLMHNEPAQPRRRSLETQPARPRGIGGHITTLLLQPEQFFRALKAASGSRQWLWAAVLILTLVGLSAVQLAARTTPAAGSVDFSDPLLEAPPPSFGDLGAPPPGVQPGGGLDVSAGGGAEQVTSTWTTVLLAASSVILGWFILALLLSEVTLLRGYAPRLGLNVQVAVWASLPLGLMAGLQLVYYAAGGAGGRPGLAGMVGSLPGYAVLPPLSQALLLSLAGQLTLFWLWSLLLIYKGARHTLGGSWWSAAFVAVAWALIVVVVPVMTGAVAAPAAEVAPMEMVPGGLMDDPGSAISGPDEGLLPPDNAAPAAPADQSELLVPAIQDTAGKR